MQFQIVPIGIVLAYMAGMFYIGFMTNKLAVRNSTDYLLAGRRMGLFMVAISLSANNIGGGSTTGLAAKVFDGWGLSAVWYILAAAIAMIPLSYFAPKIRKTMAVTIPEVVNRRFGTRASTFTAVLNVISSLFLTSSQILASGLVISSITAIPLNAGILIAGAVIVLYTTMGGMLADAISDVMQFLILFFGLLISIPFIINGAGGLETILSGLPPSTLSFTKLGAMTTIGLVLNYFCTFLSGPEMVSRFSAAESPKTAFRGSILSAFFMAMVAFLPVIIGLVVFATNPELDGGTGNTALMYGAIKYAPPWVAGAVASAIISATMSSADSNLLCASSILVKDIYQARINPGVKDKQVILYTRVSNMVICFISMAIAMLHINFVTLNLFAFALRSAGPFAAYALGMVVKDATKNAGIISIITGSVSVIIWQFLDSPFEVLPIIFGCLSGCISFLLVTKIEKKMGKPPAPSAYS